MKTKYVLLLFMCFFIKFVSAQSFRHSVGGTVTVMSATIKVPSANPQYSSSPYSEIYNFVSEQFGLTYFPRFNFIETKGMSISIGFPLTFGVGVASNMLDDEDAGFSVNYDLPAVLDINLGHNSSKKNEKTFGGFIGGGYGYNYLGYNLSKSGSEKAKSYGPLFHAGASFLIAHKESMTIGIFLKGGQEFNKFTTFGIEVFHNFK